MAIEQFRILHEIFENPNCDHRLERMYQIREGIIEGHRLDDLLDENEINELLGFVLDHGDNTTNDNCRHARRIAAECLGRRQSIRDQALESLIRAIRDTDHDLTVMAIWAIGKIANREQLPDHALGRLRQALDEIKIAFNNEKNRNNCSKIRTAIQAIERALGLS
jgi:hypothetical protein